MSQNRKKIGSFEVNPIGIGTWEIGGRFNPDSRKEEREIEAIRYSIKNGQNHIDTAEMYSSGHSEEVVGRAIKGFDRDRLFVASKLYKSSVNPKSAPKAVEGMLRRLGTEYLDLVYIHACFNEEEIPNYAKALDLVMEKGLVKNIGLSNFDLRELKKVMSLVKNPISALQNHYNIIYQEEVDQEMKTYCAKNNITIVTYKPLENCQSSKTVLQMAEKYDKTPEQIALNWLIMQENVVTITKSLNKNHIDENLLALEFDMEKEDMEKLYNMV